MSKNNKNKLVPKLRFPEFLNDEEWLDYTIDSIGEVVTGGTPSKEEKEYWGGDFVWATAQDFKNKYISDSVLKLTQKGKEKSRIIPKDSVLVTCIASIGLNAINKVECATNQQINSIVCNPENHYEFVYYSITHNGIRLKNMAGQTAVPIINKSVFEKFVIHKPKSFHEQQKIASCLSSLDDVITAETQKLELLKEHKKGLLQNLFPQEGETVPRLRFKEFRNAGNWKPEPLGQLSDVRDGTHDSPKFFSTGKPLVTSKNLLPDGTLDLINTNLISEQDYEQINKRSRVDVGDILFGMIGTIGNPVMVNTDGFAIKNVALIKQRYKLLNKFLAQLLNSGYLVAKLSILHKGNAQKFIALGVLRNLEILYPSPEEQQKIAECVSFLDELITAQTEKIVALQKHKKGLMQGLFPDINEVN